MPKLKNTMKNFEPDFSQFEKVLKKGKPDRPVFFEYYVDPAVVCPHENRINPDIKDAAEAIAERDIRVFKHCRADYATLRIHDYGFTFPHPSGEGGKTISLNACSSVETRADFERFPWPDPEKADYGVFERCEKYLPCGMKLMVDAPMGLLENLVRITGYENLCYMLFEDPALAKDLADKIGGILLRHYEKLAHYPTIGAFMINDDWGFNTQPMLAPQNIRELIKPWHVKFAAAAHAGGKYAIMHSCGQLKDLMEDIICDIRMDAKHSYEDNITPIEDFYEIYKTRIAILGGLDIDFLCRRPPEQIYARAKAMLERAQSCGGYALGSGNSIPYYVPKASFDAMQRALVE